MNCPLCTEPLSERGFFCKVCAGQVRCLSCRELLEPSAIACVECGTRVDQAANGYDRPPLPPADRVTHPYTNTLSYQEDRNSRKLEASLTDNAMQSLGGVLGDFFVQRGLVRAAMPGRVSSEVIAHGTKELPAAGKIAAVALPTSPPPIASQGPLADDSSDKSRVMRLFGAKGDALELMDNRLKAKSGAEFLRKFTYLFLYAHECHGRQAMAEDDLIKAMRAAKVWDRSGNARKWLNSRVGITTEGEDRIKLNNIGREEAVEALNVALNQDIPDEWNPDKNVPKRGARKKKA